MRHAPDVRFLIGRAGTGKTMRIVDEIVTMLRKDPLGDPVLLLVPDQATLLYERLIGCDPRVQGYVRLCVITFRQLTDMLLREGGGSAITEVTPLGRRILIGRLLRRMQPDLTFYKSTARQPGLAAKLDQAFAEIEHTGRTPDDLLYLAADIEAQHPHSALPAKLRDIKLLLQEYEVMLGSDRLDQHRRLRQALESVGRSTTLRTATLYVDSFYEFTRTERQLLTQIAVAGRCPTTIALTLDPRDALPFAMQTPLAETHPFRATTHTLRRLYRDLDKAGALPQIQTLTAARRFVSKDILHVDRQFCESTVGRMKPTGDLRLIETAGRREEVDAAARQILAWLGDGMRLRDVLVLARDVDEYERHVELSFREHNIGFFVDRQEPASHHPLIRAVRSILQVALTDWHHGAIIELIKCGLLGIRPEDGDAIENYILAHRIRGSDAWRRDWGYRSTGRRREEDAAAAVAAREELLSINGSRQRLVTGLHPLTGDGDNRDVPTSHWCQRLCESLDRLQVNQALSDRIARLEAAGDVEAAARHREVWSEFAELLDQLCSVLSSEPLTLREFAEVVDVALERFTLTITPPTIDQVLIGGVERTRTGPVRACIVLGLSEGQFPKRSEEATALSDEDRRLLELRQIETGTNSRLALLDEQFYGYVALTRASHRLTLIRSSADEEGRQSPPSAFWTKVASMFPELPIERVGIGTSIDRIATPRQLVEATVQWSLKSGSEAPPAGAAQLTSWMLASPEPRVAALRDTLERAIAYDNVATLSPALAAQLFPSPLRASATQLETFAACPFKHFVQHGLKLAAREEADLTRMDLGTIYHRVLENLVRRAIQERQDVTQPMPDLSEQIRELGHAAAAELRDELMLTPGRNQYLLEDMQRTLEDVVETQRHALSLGRFRPQQAEHAFGYGKSAPPLEIRTPAGRTVELRGKIDRIDTIELPDRLAATVIDYKLSGQRADFDRIYFGLSLQLVTYLLVLSAMGEGINGKPITPAAALYVRLLRRIESVEHPTDAPEPHTRQFHLGKNNKARGIIDEQFVDDLDHALSKSWSEAYAIQRTDKPIETRRADVLGHESFAALIEWTRHKIGQLADQVIDGRVEVRPYKLKTMSPCGTCDHRAVCRIDLGFNRYFFITPAGNVKLETIVQEAQR